MLSDPLAITGVFMLGASAGALFTHIKHKHAFAECRKARELSLQSGNAPAIPESRFVLRVLVVGRDPEMIRIMSHLLLEKSIEAHICPPESAVDQLSCHKFAALVLDCDEVGGCSRILKNLPHPNKSVVIFGVANGEMKHSASALGAAFVIERPLVPSQIRTSWCSLWTHAS